MVLLAGYGEWVLGSDDDGPRTRDLGLHHPFGTVRVESNAFRLKERPQIYQRMLDNALYGFTRIPRLEGDPVPKQPDPKTSPDLIPTEPKDDGKKSVLGRRSYIDDILITAESWDHLCGRVEGLLDVCEEWTCPLAW
ncbi:hypothetical protein PR001_g22928 [Phytophthora rubi]|uniref:Reverse transcriptase domain-containing protein n=1 Tax=Phytophthora rubi TaxID=129364 RepID=A0A6A3IWH6_9STRA|nr:hypothetical protein PR001_g22928 [Phytophthora rubi]